VACFFGPPWRRWTLLTYSRCQLVPSTVGHKLCKKIPGQLCLDRVAIVARRSPTRRSPYRWSKKLTPFVLYALILSNIDRFSNVFHCQNQHNIYVTFVIILSLKIPPHLKCEMWNISVLNATIENKTTSVTTHLKSASYGSKVDTLNIWTITAGCVSYFTVCR